MRPIRALATTLLVASVALAGCGDCAPSRTGAGGARQAAPLPLLFEQVMLPAATPATA